MISASRKYILLHTYFVKVIQYVDLYQPRFANSWRSKTSRNPRRAHNYNKANFTLPLNADHC